MPSHFDKFYFEMLVLFSATQLSLYHRNGLLDWPQLKSDLLLNKHTPYFSKLFLLHFLTTLLPATLYTQVISHAFVIKIHLCKII